MKSCADVRLRSGNAEYYFKFLKWDSKFFGRNCYILDAARSRLRPSLSMRKLINRRFYNCFITAKIDTACDRSLLEFLQLSGFRYIETEIILKYQTVSRQQRLFSPNQSIIEVKQNMNLPYEELGSVFTMTRFHSDVHIPRDQADLLWIEYIKNHIPSSAERLFIAKKGKEVAGAVIVNINRNRRRADISFVSVREKFRHIGIGSGLISYVIQTFGHKGFYVGTQASNIAALNFYIKNGFSIIEKSMIVFHRWS